MKDCLCVDTTCTLLLLVSAEPHVVKTWIDGRDGTMSNILLDRDGGNIIILNLIHVLQYHGTPARTYIRGRSLQIGSHDWMVSSKISVTPTLLPHYLRKISTTNNNSTYDTSAP